YRAIRTPSGHDPPDGVLLCRCFMKRRGRDRPIVWIWHEAAGRATFLRRPVYGPRRAFAPPAVPYPRCDPRLDRDATDYRPGDGERVGTPRPAYKSAAT